MLTFSWKRKTALVLGLIILAVGGPMAGPAAHAAYPDKPINLVVPFSAGGSGDILARMVAEHLYTAWKQPVIVQNKPGAGGQIAMSYVARSPADGYTLAITSSGTVGVNPYLYKNLPYDPVKDFDHVTILADLPLILVVRNDSPFKTMEQFVVQAKAHPGVVSLGNAGVGSHQYLAASHFASQAGVSLNLIPYKGGGEVVSALLSGTVDGAMDNVITQTPLMHAGKTRGLAVASRQRLAFLPDVPTFSEVGIKSDFGMAFYGIAAPAGTPRDIVESLQTEIAKYLRSPEIVKRLSDMAVVGTASTPDETTAIVKNNLGIFATITQKLGIQPQ